MKFQERAKKQSGDSSRYLKVGDGETVSGIFRGEVYSFHVKWVGGKSQVTDSNDREAKLRHKVNVVVYEGNKFVAKVFEFPDGVYEQLGEVNKKCGGALEKFKVKIARSGIEKATRYFFLPEEKPLSEVVLKAIALVDLNILDGKKAEAQAPADEFPPDFGDPPPDDFNEHEPEIPF